MEKGEGLAWLKGVPFSTGTIEVDLKAQDVFNKSWLGIAFHVANDSVYECVCFAPFHFITKDSVVSIQAVQYISYSVVTWKNCGKNKTIF